jgi:hypothetical protein
MTKEEKKTKDILFFFCLDKYDQLKKYVLMFFNTSNDDHLLSYGQQQMLNIQETFFNSKSFNFEIFN